MRFLIIIAFSACLPAPTASMHETTGELSFHPSYIHNVTHDHACASEFHHSKPPNPAVKLSVLHPRSACLWAAEVGDGRRGDELRYARLASGRAGSRIFSGNAIGTRNYVMRVGIGTPAIDAVVVMDTASDVGWIQCVPCAGCYPQKDSYFNPSHSSSFTSLPCASPLCAQLAPGSRGCSPAATCTYAIRYGDASIAAGGLATETLTIAGFKIPGYTFGCGHHNLGLFHGADGLLGLGRGQLSFVAQTSHLFTNRFSYCLPSPSRVGFIEFGQKAADSGSTPLLMSPAYPSFYFVNVERITMGGHGLLVDTSFTPLIDSGTVISRLPSAIYAAARDAFRAAMAATVPEAASPDPSFLDTCYNLSSSGSHALTVPLLSFHMGGGLAFTVPPDGMLAQVDRPSFTFCFAFAESGDGSLSIIGNTQQQGSEFGFDLHASTLNIRPHAC